MAAADPRKTNVKSSIGISIETEIAKPSPAEHFISSDQTSDVESVTSPHDEFKLLVEAALQGYLGQAYPSRTPDNYDRTSRNLGGLYEDPSINSSTTSRTPLDPDNHVCLYRDCVATFGTISLLHEHERKSHILASNPDGAGNTDALKDVDALPVKTLSQAKRFGYSVVNSATGTPCMWKFNDAVELEKSDFEYGGEITDITGASNESQQQMKKLPSPFQCNVCAKPFTRKFNLNSHMMSHSNNRPHECSVCGHKFVRRHDLKVHKALHSGAIKFVCRARQNANGGCGREFTRASALKRHWRSEAGRGCAPRLVENQDLHSSPSPREQGLFSTSALTSAPRTVEEPPQSQHGTAQSPYSVISNYTLPASLLAQYPALKNKPWTGIVDDGTSEPWPQVDLQHCQE